LGAPGKKNGCAAGGNAKLGMILRICALSSSKSPGDVSEVPKYQRSKVRRGGGEERRDRGFVSDVFGITGIKPPFKNEMIID
jgi:hypothetical protein